MTRDKDCIEAFMGCNSFCKTIDWIGNALDYFWESLVSKALLLGPDNRWKKKYSYQEATDFPF